MSLAPCRLCFVAGATAIALAVCAPRAPAGEETIRLGGLRNVTASVTESDDVYRIAVEMLPVKAFDPATNKALNASKAGGYAVRALAKHLKMDALIVRGLEVKEAAANGKTFRLVAVVPRSGVSAPRGTSASAERRKPAETENTARRGAAAASKPDAQASGRQPEIRLAADATTADFLNRKADYMDTIARLREALTEEGDALARRSLKPDDFYDSIGGIEDRAEAACKTLARQIEDDNLLSELGEREELRPALKQARAEVLMSLKEAVARFDRRQEKMKQDKEKN